MSRVTIANIVGDYDANRYPYDGGRIEVVPRRMVEMIIEKCVSIMDENLDDDNRIEIAKWNTADDMRAYAESLLMEFEED